MKPPAGLYELLKAWPLGKELMGHVCDILPMLSSPNRDFPSEAQNTPKSVTTPLVTRSLDAAGRGSPALCTLFFDNPLPSHSW